ncbi:mitotic spindle assembly checkpoint protein MAD1-like [Thamnophis elegans]|uniref:mitotic spindle assembly checkpoint protein MAD1-like n=1 Tax=Thamnophis elegans TaxID=35005 RepID=UPI00137789EE|nr:mitotic spindle assembly checkpoint protein MAD1-like [Thamnophis elegans]
MQKNKTTLLFLPSVSLLPFFSARLLENSRKQLQEELLKVQSQLLDEKKKREQQETMVKYLQKHMQLLIKARDGMRSILEFYDSELNPSEHSPQLSFRVREAEELVQKVEAHCMEMEVAAVVGYAVQCQAIVSCCSLKEKED